MRHDDNGAELNLTPTNLTPIDVDIHRMHAGTNQ
jgi:hypothetical protein